MRDIKKIVVLAAEIARLEQQLVLANQALEDEVFIRHGEPDEPAEPKKNGVEAVLAPEPAPIGHQLPGPKTQLGKVLAELNAHPGSVYSVASLSHLGISKTAVTAVLQELASCRWISRVSPGHYQANKRLPLLPAADSVAAYVLSELSAHPTRVFQARDLEHLRKPTKQVINALSHLHEKGLIMRLSFGRYQAKEET